jgi:hypothetical protein
MSSITGYGRILEALCGDGDEWTIEPLELVCDVSSMVERIQECDELTVDSWDGQRMTVTNKHGRKRTILFEQY